MYEWFVSQSFKSYSSVFEKLHNTHYIKHVVYLSDLLIPISYI